MSFEGPDHKEKRDWIITIANGGTVAERLLTGQAKWRDSHYHLESVDWIMSPLTAMDDDERSSFTRWMWYHTRKGLRFKPNWAAVEALATQLLIDHHIREQRAVGIISNAREAEGQPGLVRLGTQ